MDSTVNKATRRIILPRVEVYIYLPGHQKCGSDKAGAIATCHDPTDVLVVFHACVAAELMAFRGVTADFMAAASPQG